jgi:type II secretory pathway component PulF
METKDWITIIGFIVVIISWFVISWLNRKNEIAKERMKFRLEILFSVLDCLDDAARYFATKGNANNNDIPLKIGVSLRRMALFGSSEDMSLYNIITSKLNSGEPMGKELNELQSHVVNKLKKELSIKEHKEYSPRN